MLSSFIVRFFVEISLDNPTDRVHTEHMRKLETIDIRQGFPVYRFKAFFLDRLRAEGVERVDVSIDDQTSIITIEPVKDSEYGYNR